ncbi:MAG TPA: alanine racemase [Polyangia bacterium]|jgi:D-serine deaminase-like pyridoxal phosphate-dependent protein
MPVPVDAAAFARYRRALAGEPLPAAIVDLDAVDANVDRLLAPARAAGKLVRIATKSLRVPALVGRVAARAGDAVHGLMTYDARETAFYATDGAALAGAAARDLVCAYPTLQPADAAALADANRHAHAAAVVDDPAQLPPLAAAARAAGTRVPVVIDVDMSWRPLASMHVGVRRSPLRDADDVLALARTVAAEPALVFAGIMGYEAQIAGVQDAAPHAAWQNPLKRALKRACRPAVARTRAAVVAALRDAKLAPAIVNGGGTGSVDWSVTDGALTEITIGSGFLAGTLFDHYAGLPLAPALFFALQATRRPTARIVTCHGGGFVASGPGAADRLPTPVFPVGARLLPLEGAGEVQTPVALGDGADVALGDPVFFRPAKSGELAEHFDEYLLVRGDRIEARAATYRGLHRRFLG